MSGQISLGDISKGRASGRFYTNQTYRSRYLIALDEAGHILAGGRKEGVVYYGMDIENKLVEFKGEHDLGLGSYIDEATARALLQYNEEHNLGKHPSPQPHITHAAPEVKPTQEPTAQNIWRDKWKQGGLGNKRYHVINDEIYSANGDSIGTVSGYIAKGKALPWESVSIPHHKIRKPHAHHVEEPVSARPEHELAPQSRPVAPQASAQPTREPTAPSRPVAPAVKPATSRLKSQLQQLNSPDFVNLPAYTRILSNILNENVDNMSNRTFREVKRRAIQKLQAEINNLEGGN